MHKRNIKTGPTSRLNTRSAHYLPSTSYTYYLPDPRPKAYHQVSGYHGAPGLGEHAHVWVTLDLDCQH